MKFNQVLLVLASSFIISCSANPQTLPLGIMEKLKISHSEPEVVDIPDGIVEAEMIPKVQQSAQPRTGCSVVAASLNAPQPLILVPSTSTIWPFSTTGSIEVDAGANVELFCPTTYTVPSGKSGSVLATCVSGTVFRIGTTNYGLADIICKSWITTTARATGATCNGGIVVETGFTVGTRFVKQLEICFNDVIEATRYSKYTLNPGNDYFTSNVARPSFSKAGFFGTQDVDTFYTQATQTATLNIALGGIASNYITGGNFYLARGHMAAMADFVYATQQRGTFLFLNAAPQWQNFNAGNWESIEDDIRNWVSANSLYVDVYTGGYGVAQLPDVNGVQTPLYLTYDSNNNGQIPVPKFYFRVIIQPSTSKGVVLIGINNPYLTLAQIQAGYMLCTDVSSQLTWLTWNRTSITAGYSYACSVPDFASVNPYLPAFNVTSLLT